MVAVKRTETEMDEFATQVILYIGGG